MDILVPRFVDQDAIKAQELNAKELFKRFSQAGQTWHLFSHSAPDPDVAANPVARIHRLLCPIPAKYRSGADKERFPKFSMKWEMFLRYQGGYDAIFYPDGKKYDLWALALRSLQGRHIPIIATVEGLAGTEKQERRFSEYIGHHVHLDRPAMPRRKSYLELADHVIAISPLLKKYVEFFYHKPCTVLPLGVDLTIFNDKNRDEPDRPRIICAGTLNDRKRPELFMRMARRFPQADFVWFGCGPKHAALEHERKAGGMENLSFPGSTPPRQLAEEMRHASVFVLPSSSEGWGKVVQEAAACGLPSIVFGFYETPLVTHGENGFVCWNDEEMMENLARLVEDAKLRRDMGAAAAAGARELSWDKVAPQWEKHVLDLIGEFR